MNSHGAHNCIGNPCQLCGFTVGYQPVPQHKVTGVAAVYPWLRGQLADPVRGNNYIGDSLAKLARYEAALRKIAEFETDASFPTLGGMVAKIAKEALDG